MSNKEKIISDKSSINPNLRSFSVFNRPNLISRPVKVEYRTNVNKTSNINRGYFIQESTSHKVKEEKITAKNKNIKLLMCERLRYRFKP